MVASTRIELGSKVMTADGKEIGSVSEVGSDRFKVERRLMPDYWLASEYVDDVSGGIVQLIVTKEGLKAAKV
jgi:hypothetical protein